jgi:BlaI family transcriptional regulator, penicillinase repressor
MEVSEPTDRELAILKILWDRDEATVREVYEILREELDIVQNTVQAFLRTMTEKGLVTHRSVGRSFVYRPLVKQQLTSQRMLARLMHRVFDGSLDQLVESAVSLRDPSPEEIAKLRALLDRTESGEGGDA